MSVCYSERVGAYRLCVAAVVALALLAPGRGAAQTSVLAPAAIDFQALHVDVEAGRRSADVRREWEEYSTSLSRNRIWLWTSLGFLAAAGAGAGYSAYAWNAESEGAAADHKKYEQALSSSSASSYRRKVKRHQDWAEVYGYALYGTGAVAGVAAFSALLALAAAPDAPGSDRDDDEAGIQFVPMAGDGVSGMMLSLGF